MQEVEQRKEQLPRHEGLKKYHFKITEDCNHQEMLTNFVLFVSSW